MNKSEAIAYEAEINLILRTLKRYEKKITVYRTPAFTKRQSVTNFYKSAILDLQSTIRNVEYAYKLHTHYILQQKEKENIITSNRYEREKSN